MALLSAGYKRHVKSLIRRLGRDVTLRQYTLSGSDFDPTRTATDTTVTAAVFDYQANEAFEGSIIQRDDKLFLVASNTVVTKQDKIVEGSKEYHLVDVESIGPGDDVFYYAIQARL